MSEKLSIEERLKKLPRRFIVAFAARAARRVQPLATAFFEQCGGNAGKLHLREIERAILIAEEFAIEQYARVARVARARAARAAYATHAANATSESSASSAAYASSAASAAAAAADAATDTDTAAATATAATAAATAATAATDAARAAADDGTNYGVDFAATESSRDLDRLEAIAATEGYGLDSDAGLDSTEDGPLGPYWVIPPNRSGKPLPKAGESATLATSLDTAGEKSGLFVEIDLPDGFSNAEMVELVAAISEGLDEVYQGFGGRGLSIKDVEIEEFDDAPVPANVD